MRERERERERERKSVRVCCNGVERNTRQGELKSKTPEGGFY